MTARLTLKSIAKACVAAGLPSDIELVKGNGYFYFWCDEAPNWYSSSVYTNFLNDLTLEQWVEEAKTLRERRY